MVRDHAVLLVEGHAGQGRPEVADGPVQLLQRDLAQLARALDAALPVGAGALVHERRRAAVVIGAHLDRLRPKVQVQSARRRPALIVDRFALAPRLQHPVDDHHLLVRRDRGLGCLVVVEVLVVHDHVDVAELTEFAQLKRRELHLRRPAAPEHVHIGDSGCLEPGLHVGGDLGGKQVLRVLGEHARHIEGDVADADDADRRGIQRPLAREVGVPVVPADEVGGPVRADRVDPGDLERGVADRAGREDDGVVVLLEVLEGEVLAEAHVAEDADVPAVEHVAQRRDDALDARVVGSYPVADEAVRRGQVVEQVDRDVELALGLQQDVRRVNAGGARADDGQPQLGHGVPLQCGTASRSLMVS